MQLKLALGVLPRGAHGWNFFVRVKFLLDPNLVSVPGVSPTPTSGCLSSFSVFQQIQANGACTAAEKKVAAAALGHA